MKHFTPDTTASTITEQIPDGTFHGEFRCNTCHWLYYQLPTAAAICPRCGNPLEIRHIRLVTRQ